MNLSTLVSLFLTFNFCVLASELTNEFAKLIEFDKNYVNITSFKYYKKSRTLGALNVTYVLFQEIVSDEQLKIKVAALQYKGTEYKRTVVDFSVGICTLYKANKFGSLDLIKDSNLKGCPFHKGPYYINNVSPGENFLPPFFPEGKWMLELLFTHVNKVVTRIHWMFSHAKRV